MEFVNQPFVQEVTKAMNRPLRDNHKEKLYVRMIPVQPKRPWQGVATKTGGYTPLAGFTGMKDRKDPESV